MELSLWVSDASKAAGLWNCGSLANVVSDVWSNSTAVRDFPGEIKSRGDKRLQNPSRALPSNSVTLKKARNHSLTQKAYRYRH
jgi:hypothetical protein